MDTDTKTMSEMILAHIKVNGIVQGVGFRPFIFQLAMRDNLNGWVMNTTNGVEIRVEGSNHEVIKFISDIKTNAPPLAKIERFNTILLPTRGYKNFKILDSKRQSYGFQLVSPDIATCDDCIDELFDIKDRRYRYPFTNCTNCGPRFTIIENLPYDRHMTTMRNFKMCPKCTQEYSNPLDRRFHAQPNACPDCGPSLHLTDSKGKYIHRADPLTEASTILRDGKILAIKGLGGFLLACNASDSLAIETLRKRKRRPSKPLAIMLPTLDDANKHCFISPEEERLLVSNQRPIVLLKWKNTSSICSSVAPQNKYLGVMLPYTPLHHVLSREAGIPLVMTSGNLSEEPITKDNTEALNRLGDIADSFLMHNRDILSRYDDSVVFVETGKPRFIRRARGYAPYPVHLPFKSQPVFACGADLKNTFCITRDEYAFLSQHIGDMENIETIEHFETTVELYSELFRVRPEVIAFDMHPEYFSSKFGRDKGTIYDNPVLIPVQHHHAHVVSCLVENQSQGPVIGIVFDGTGFGTDGYIWGGEFLLADFNGFRRMGHFQYVPLPGGAISIHRPYRMAISYLLTLSDGGILPQKLPFLDQVNETELSIIKQQISRGITSPLTSSCGRLFDAVSALIGIRGIVDYEAQAAIELEMIADEKELSSYPFSIDKLQGKYVFVFHDMFLSIINDIVNRTPQSVMSMKFHNTIVEVLARTCNLISADTGVKQVVLTGGTFQNRLLLRRAISSLERSGFTVFTHQYVPSNDGGISLGQAVIANSVLKGK